MFKSCQYCRFCYYPDLDDVSGFRCELYDFLHVTEPTKHYCLKFKFSWIRFFGLL
jgi:hypothetical protein